MLFYLKKKIVVIINDLNDNKPKIKIFSVSNKFNSLSLKQDIILTKNIKSFEFSPEKKTEFGTYFQVRISMK